MMFRQIVLVILVVLSPDIFAQRIEVKTLTSSAFPHQVGVISNCDKMLDLRSNEEITDMPLFVPIQCFESYKQKYGVNYNILAGVPKEAKVTLRDGERLEDAFIRMKMQPNDVHFLSIEGVLNNEDFALIRDYMPQVVLVDMSKAQAQAIPDYTFAEKQHLQSVSLPSNVERIGECSFANCSQLRGAIYLPQSVSSIEKKAFIGCSKLKSVVALGTHLTGVGEHIFGRDNNSKLIYR